VSDIIPKNPHDQFFKALFSKPELAAELIRSFVPSDVVQALDLRSLALAKDSLVDKELRAYYSDLVFQVQADGRPGYVYILLEHKSYRDDLLPLQLLRYIVRLYERHVRRSKQRLPLPFVVPLVLYHGQRPEVSSNILDLFDKDLVAFHRYVPSFQIEIANLTQEDDSRLRNLGIVSGVALLMKHIRDRDLQTKLPGILDLILSTLAARSGTEAFEMVLRYVATAATSTDPEELFRILEEKGGETMGSVAEMLFNKGLQKGVEEARAAILDLLEVKFGEQGSKLAEEAKRLSTIDALEQFRIAIKQAKAIDEASETLRRILSNQR